MDVYSGPEYMFFFKYAYLIKIIAFAMIYGSAMPIVFPIVLFGITNFSVSEKLAIIYFYKKPPTIDSKVSNLAIELLTRPPVYGMMFATWVMGNQAMFTNLVSPIGNLFDSENPQHHFFRFWLNPMPSWMSMVGIMILLAFPSKFMRTHVFKYLNSAAEKIDKVENMPVELPCYFNALSGLHQMKLYTRMLH